MMDTAIPYDEINILDKILNILLLGKTFEWEVLLSPEQCEYRLSGLASPDVKTWELYEHAYGCEATLRGGYMTGVIYTDQALEKTIFKGYVRVGITSAFPLFAVAFFPMLVVVMAYLAAPALHLLDGCFGCVPLVLLLVVVLHLGETLKGKVDRDQLYDLLEAAFPIENISKGKKHDE